MNEKPANARSQKSQEIMGNAKTQAPDNNDEQVKTTKSAKTKANSKGVVVNCIALNVREKPNADATPVHIIPEGTGVLVDFMESTEEYYKVSTTDESVTGYCNRQYIQVM